MTASLTDIVDKINTADVPDGVKTKIVAIDGGGGAGKSTLAKKLSTALGDAPIVQTDDFASWDNPFNWGPRLLEEALKPLAAQKPARFRLSEYNPGQVRGWGEVKPAPLIILEGVGSSQLAFRPYLTYTIWVDTPRDVRFHRGLTRDGEHKRADWVRWQKEEDEFMAREQPEMHANVVVKGVS
jgi:uridine kinase